MKKVLAFVLALVMVLSLVACGKQDPAGDSNNEGTATDPITIVFASIMSGDCLSNQTAKKFCELVKERSGGRIEVEFYPDCVLGNENECVQMMKTNEIQMCYFGSNFGAIMCPAYDVTLVPYLMQNVEDVRNFYLNDEVMSPLIASEIKEVANCYLIGLNNRPAHQLSSNKEIRTPADLKGFQLRIPEVTAWSTVWGGMGALPTVVAWSECYSALQTGVVDGEENPIDTKYGNKIQEVVDYIIETNHVYDTWHWCINADFLDGLSAEDQELIKTAAKDACDWGDAQVEATVAAQTKEFKDDYGIEFIPIDAKEFAAAATPYIKQYAEATWAPETIEWANEYLESYGLAPLS